jgi:flagellar biosynthesis protein FlhB
MAEKSAAERTEEATPQRLKKARGEGQIAQSQEVPSAMILGALIIALALTAGQSYQWFASQMRDGLLFSTDRPLSSDVFGDVLYAKGVECFAVLLPILLALVMASVASSLMVAGWAYSPKAIRMDLSRVSPIKGLKNLISLKSIVKLLVSIAKMTVLLALAWHYISSRLGILLELHWSSASGVLFVAAQLIMGLGVRIIVALAAIAAIDFLYQRWNYRRQLKMTRQEVKEEHKEHEVSSEVKGRIRSLQMAMSQKRTLQEVPNADVVIANPTHFAVAIRYDSSEMPAPQVVAKGADFMCQKIKEIARESGVPVIEKPELARAIYAAVEPGEVIPEAMFVAVAEILATIYRLKKQAPALSLDTSK